MEEYMNPVRALDGKQLSQEIQEALKSLSEKQLMAFQLKVLHGMSIREISEVMEAAEGTVKSHLFRATRFLREALKDWAQPEGR
jgi:RNA polymerase sigma-70 factor (ECF subfamily)